MDANLLPGERVLWEGRPQRHRLFRRSDVLLVPFSVLWCGFAIFWLAGALSAGAPLYFVLWGVPFVLVGLYIAAGRLVVRVVSSRRTRYTITNSRLLVLGGWSGNRLTTECLKSLPPPIIEEQPDGSGVLAFGAFPEVMDVFTVRHHEGLRAWSSDQSVTPILWDVPSVRRARDFVVHAQSDNTHCG